MSSKPDYSADFAAAHDMTAFIESLTSMISETADSSDLSIMQPKECKIIHDNGYIKIYSFDFDTFTIRVDVIAGIFNAVLVIFGNGYKIANMGSGSLLHRYAKDLVVAYFGDLL